MRASVRICAILLAMPLAAADRMTVSVCTRGRLDEKAVTGAEETAAALFRAVDIEVVWATCETGLEGDAAVQQHWFTVRLRDGEPFIRPGPGTRDTLGEAFLSLDNDGYIADVYHQAVESLCASKQLDLDRVLGYVIAHELGHLLLGPGHAAQGVMRAEWDLRDLQAISQHRLQFSSAEGLRMRRVLDVSPGSDSTAP